MAVKYEGISFMEQAGTDHTTTGPKHLKGTAIYRANFCCGNICSQHMLLHLKWLHIC